MGFWKVGKSLEMKELFWGWPVGSPSTDPKARAPKSWLKPSVEGLAGVLRLVAEDLLFASDPW